VRVRPGRGGIARWTIQAALGPMLALTWLSARVSAQEPRGLEAGLEAATALANPAFAGAGVSVGIRPGGGTRVVVSVMPGVQRSRLAGRGELLGQFMLTPANPHGVGFYGLAGIAGQVGRRDGGWLVLGLGMERAPASGSGWHIEAGIGGGVRVSVGWRWRWLRAAGAVPP
jgi:hypothetical protein